MAKNITFNLMVVDKATGTFRAIQTQAKNLDEAMDKAEKQITKTFDQARKEAQATAVKMAAVTVAFDSINSAVQGLNSYVADLTSAYSAQIQVETQLATNMRNTMAATDAQIQSIKDLCSAQQALGVVGDEVQLAGAQELATYLSKKESLDKLIPVMNDMLAQQYGLTASQENASQIATMLGKVMDGQVGALSRYGYSFDEAQEKILKYGTESERAAVLADVVSASVGGMNAALAATDAGKQKQLENTLGDVKEQAGQAVQSLQPFLTFGASLTSSLTGIGKFAAGIQAVYAAVGPLISATKTWTAVQTVLNGVLSLNPLGIVLLTISALIPILRALYVNCEWFRDICDDIWSGVKVVGEWFAWLGDKIVKHLIKRFNETKETIATVWRYVKKIFGIEDSDELPRATAAAAVNMGTLCDETEDTSEAVDKLADKLGKLGQTGRVSVDTTTPGQRRGADLGVDVWSLDTLEQYEARIKTLRDLQQTADRQHYAELQKQLELVEQMAETFKKGVPTVEPAPVGDQVNAALGATGFNTERPKDLKLAGADKSITKLRTEMGRTVNYMDELSKGWGGFKSGVGAVESMTEAIKGNGSAWEKTTAIIDGALGVYQSVSAVMAVIKTLTDASSTAKTAETAATVAGTTATVSDTAAKGAQATANVEAAASGMMAAHSGIPFAGIGIAAGMIAAMVALMATLPKFADGGVAFGPTLGVFGEYPGARSNPEVVAPLSKLKQYIADAVPARGDGIGGDVHFRISGRDLEGVLVKRTNFVSRS